MINDLVEFEIDKRLFNRMREAAQHRFMKHAKRPEESADEFVARCWVESLMDIIEGEGYDLTVTNRWSDITSRVNIKGRDPT